MAEPKEYFLETDSNDIQQFVLIWKIKYTEGLKDQTYLASEVFDIEVEPKTNNSFKVQLFLERGWYDQVHGAQIGCISAKFKTNGNFNITNVEVKSYRLKRVSENVFSYKVNNNIIPWVTEADGSYVIKCLINVLKVSNDIEKTTPKIPVLDDNLLTANLINDFDKLYVNESYSDLIITSIDKKVFSVHKNVLSSRCPYFEKVIKDSDELELQIHSEVLKKVLKFIYTGKVQDVKEMCLPILKAAFQLELKGLLKICEAVVISQITIEDAPQTLILADDYSMMTLREEVIRFIVENAEEVGKLSLWREMMKTHPHLIAEVTFQLQVANSKK